MPFDLLLDDSGDISTPARTATGTALIRQRIRRRLRTLTGDWFLDPSVGLPYLDWIATKPPPVAQISAATREAVLAVPGVLRVDGWGAVHDADARTVRISGVVYIEGDAALSLLVTGDDTPDPINAAPWAVLLEELF